MPDPSKAAVELLEAFARVTGAGRYVTDRAFTDEFLAGATGSRLLAALVGAVRDDCAETVLDRNSDGRGPSDARAECIACAAAIRAGKEGGW